MPRVPVDDNSYIVESRQLDNLIRVVAVARKRLSKRVLQRHWSQRDRILAIQKLRYVIRNRERSKFYSDVD
jgi:hypothetical protein